MCFAFPFLQRNLVRMRAVVVSQGQASGDRWGETINVTSRKQKGQRKSLKKSSAVCSHNIVVFSSSRGRKLSII